ncbi:hypothetical protein G6L29_12395 [Agrobacterium rhizogenes]|uniref:Uncharacterized protein n=1 Tax=Rhizobium rhizogenes NBRC 13257 TaxID=1220581 RepID=A0AA87U1Z4_RHIRH|nr:hypothetical protein [Rhizobium rhizogenes]KEA06144.1 hypothetical protein CN09_03935 [Rhizobium rhizogenes]MDJ1635863.1 hypothetical protein [Rhizobium rhizogenes]MQB30301.1 hypothetical protein [Rhizobium rhizogenes]NTF55854.1 hypothetical protein [Rhizobium rhizogenes]NTF62230.1 hypothetical protein [Rhizobium rhizogenes]
MVKVHSFDGALDKARVTLDDAIKGLVAANTMLASHAKRDTRLGAVNFPVEEAQVRETLELLDRWKSLARLLVRELDEVTAAADLQHRRLFDEKAGAETSTWFGRRIGQGHAKPASIVAELDAALAASASLEALFREARPLLVQAFRDCETRLEQVIERRQRVDLDIEDAQRQADDLALRIVDRRVSVSSKRDVDSQSEPEAEYRRLLAEQEDLHVRERALQPGRVALQRLIDIYEGVATILNAQVAAVNAMAAKLAVDTEQRIALLKAVTSEAAPPLPAVERPATVAALIRAFEANVLAGHDLARRKEHADKVFARRLESPLPAVPVTEGEQPVEPEPETSLSSAIEK